MQMYILEPNMVIGNRWARNAFYWAELNLILVKRVAELIHDASDTDYWFFFFVTVKY